MKIKLIILLALISFNLLKAQNSNLDEGLILYYPFNGNAKDESGNGNDGSVFNATLVQDKFGSINSSYFFNGNGYIQVKNRSILKELNSLTLSIWFKTTGFHQTNYNWAVLLSRSSYSNSRERHFAIGHTQSGYIYYNRDWKQTDLISVNKWQHLLLTDDNSGKVKVFLNGDYIFDLTVDKKYKGDYNLDIGRDIPGDAEYYKGYMDNIRIYNRALSDCEIKLLYLQEKNLAPKQRIDKYVKYEFENWSQKGKYESKKQQKKRINAESDSIQRVMKNQIIESISNEIQWECGDIDYDAENEKFELKFNNVELFKVSVPASEAEDFGENLDKLEYLNPEFSIGNEPNLIVDCITIKNTVNGKEYKYGCEKIPPKPAPTPNPNTPTFSNSTVTVKIWDEQKEDGDIVSVFLNGARIKKEITVKKSEHIFTLELKKGMNTFKLLAHNEGKTSPNTAAILIDDGVKEYKTVLSSKKGESAELKIVLE